MSFSIVDNPQLAIGLALGLILVIAITIKFTWKRKNIIKADKGGVAVNGANKGTIKASYRKGK
ncbi:hypothetical protein [Pseudomonas orientalis]|uniref:hypothetical protein n=1 Tax=Pseudomonas orientalis TaxID=76758 RepID=UPI000F5659FA|nr:hypothetical protein [Pseudomonas orientalis]AZE86918.1 hypothetical protein C4J97_0184 [Pseudomonas orientalis]